jgi:hypothetical protein
MASCFEAHEHVEYLLFLRCELTLASGPHADVRAGTTRATPWRASDKGILPISLDDYLKLLDWTSRKVVAGKRGSIPVDMATLV